MKSKSRGLLMAVGYAAFAIATCGTSALYAGEESEYLNFTAVGGDVLIGMRVTKVPGPSFTPSATLEYSFDPTNGRPWKKLTIGGSMTIPGGQTAYFRGSISNRFAFQTSGTQLLTRCCFTMSADNEVTIKAGGNILSLHYSDLKHQDLKALQQNTVAGLFEDCDILTEPPLLTSTNLTAGCYKGLFSGCAALARAPELPAEVLKGSCYAEMFSGCSSLIKGPTVSAVVMEPNCCAKMFTACSNLMRVAVHYNCSNWDPQTHNFEWLKDTSVCGIVSGNLARDDPGEFIPKGWQWDPDDEWRYIFIPDDNGLSVEIKATDPQGVFTPYRALVKQKDLVTIFFYSTECYLYGQIAYQIKVDREDIDFSSSEKFRLPFVEVNCAGHEINIFSDGCGQCVVSGSGKVSSKDLEFFPLAPHELSMKKSLYVDDAVVLEKDSLKSLGPVECINGAKISRFLEVLDAIGFRYEKRGLVLVVR